MFRRSLIIGGLVASLGASCLAGPVRANEIAPYAKGDLLTPALLQQIQQVRPGQAQVPAPTPPQGNFFSNLTLGQVIGAMTGAVAGKVLLEGILDLPQGVGVVVGAVGGYYIWVNYISTLDLGPSAGPRKTNADGSEARAYLIGDALIDLTSPLLRPAALQR